MRALSMSHLVAIFRHQSEEGGGILAGGGVSPVASLLESWGFALIGSVALMLSGGLENSLSRPNKGTRVFLLARSNQEILSHAAPVLPVILGYALFHAGWVELFLKQSSCSKQRGKSSQRTQGTPKMKGRPPGSTIVHTHIFSRTPNAIHSTTLNQPKRNKTLSSSSVHYQTSSI